MSLEKAIPQSDPPIERIRVDRLLTSFQVSKILKVSRATLKDWRQGTSGPGPQFVRLPGLYGRVRYSAMGVSAWLRAQMKRQERQQARRKKVGRHGAR